MLNQKQGTHVPQNVLADCAKRIQRAHDKLDAAKEQGFFRGAISSLLGNNYQAQFQKVHLVSELSSPSVLYPFAMRILGRCILVCSW